jgi:hypothetical protein
MLSGGFDPLLRLITAIQAAYTAGIEDSPLLDARL